MARVLVTRRYTVILLLLHRIMHIIIIYNIMGRPRLDYLATVAAAHATTHRNDFVIHQWLNGSLQYRNRNSVRREEEKSYIYISPDENQTSSGWSAIYPIPSRTYITISILKTFYVI